MYGDLSYEEFHRFALRAKLYAPASSCLSSLRIEELWALAQTAQVRQRDWSPFLRKLEFEQAGQEAAIVASFPPPPPFAGGLQRALAAVAVSADEEVRDSVEAAAEAAAEAVAEAVAKLAAEAAAVAVAGTATEAMPETAAEVVAETAAETAAEAVVETARETMEPSTLQLAVESAGPTDSELAQPSAEGADNDEPVTPGPGFSAALAVALSQLPTPPAVTPGSRQTLTPLEPSELNRSAAAPSARSTDGMGQEGASAPAKTTRPIAFGTPVLPPVLGMRVEGSDCGAESGGNSGGGGGADNGGSNSGGGRRQSGAPAAANSLRSPLDPALKHARAHLAAVLTGFNEELRAAELEASVGTQQASMMLRREQHAVVGPPGWLVAIAHCFCVPMVPPDGGRPRLPLAA